jgi:hypothetical protein
MRAEIMCHVVHWRRILPLLLRGLMGTSSALQHRMTRANSAEAAWRGLRKCMKNCDFSIIRRSPRRSNPYRVGQIWGHRQASASKILPGGNHADSGRFDRIQRGPTAFSGAISAERAHMRGRCLPNQPDFEPVDLAHILEAKRRMTLAKNTALL